MVKFHTKANPQGQYYLPKEVREELGEEIDLICNARAAIIYNSKTPLEQVLKSLRVLSNDLQHRLEMQKEAPTAHAVSKTVGCCRKADTRNMKSNKLAGFQWMQIKGLLAFGAFWQNLKELQK